MNIITVIDYLILLILIVSSHLFSRADMVSYATYLGAARFFTIILSIIALIMYAFKRKSINRVMLSLYLWLISFTGIVWIGVFLKQRWSLPNYSLFIYLIAIGILSTFLTNAGFINSVNDAPQRIRNNSLLLLAAALPPAIISYAIPFYFSEIIGMFLIVLWLSELLRKNYDIKKE